MKVIWEQLMKAANTYTDFKLKYNISAFNEKTNFLVCLFYCFFRLPVYEAIAAISWQPASVFFICFEHVSIDVEVGKPMIVVWAIFMWKNQELYTNADTLS